MPSLTTGWVDLYFVILRIINEERVEGKKIRNLILDLFEMH